MEIIMCEIDAFYSSSLSNEPIEVPTWALSWEKNFFLKIPICTQEKYNAKKYFVSLVQWNVY